MRPGRACTAVLAAGVLAGLAGCGGDTAPAGSGPAEQLAWARVSAPRDWTVLDAAERPAGWDWAAQDAAGEQASVQLAVDGELGHFSDTGLALGVLQAAPQVGALPQWRQAGRTREVSVAGADSAEQLPFTYRTDDGGPAHGAWVVACQDGTRQCIAAQVTATRELPPEEVDGLLEHVRVAP